MSVGPVNECESMQCEMVNDTREPVNETQILQHEGDDAAVREVRGGQTNDPVFPILRRATLKAWLRGPNTPTILVAFEFSGAMRSALEARGKKALSVDWRSSERPGPHFQGDVREALDLKEWEAVYFVGPNCYQMLRGDADCLPRKMADGRTFWAIAFLLYCLCCPNTQMLLIEQPDTVAHEYLPLEKFEDVEVHEWRTTQYGDSKDKFMRLTTRNMLLPPPEQPEAKRGTQAPRTQFAYPTPDERDRDRSSWAHYPKMCATLAKATPIRPKMSSQIDYVEAIEWLAYEWHRRGHKVPSDYNNVDARPSTQADRQYQLIRGPGDGRELQEVIPRLAERIQTVGEPPKQREAAESTQEGDRMPAIPVGDSTTGAESTPQAEETTAESDNAAERSRVARPSQRGASLEAAPPNDSNTLVIPVHATENDIEALLPANPELVLSLGDKADTHRPASKTQAAENGVLTLLGLEKKPMGMRIGTTDSGTQIIATVIDAQATVKTGQIQAKRRGRSGGLVALAWCTLSMLATGGGQAAWGRLVLCTMKQYQAQGAHTMWYHQTEAKARLETGARPGKGPLLGPERQRLRTGGGVRGRDLIEMANAGTRALQHALRTTQGPFRDYLSEWSDSVQPLNLAEVPKELLDKDLRLGDNQLNEELFAPRLPVYELPWLERMPEQQPLEGRCAGFVATNAMELLETPARKAVEAWLRQAEKDLKCLEERGPECQREDRPPVLVLGQQDMVKCAQGKVWDCRKARGCELLDYAQPIQTDFDLTHLRKRFRDYPDQRLASNILEGIRLEADVEHQIVLHPNLISVGRGYDSVQDTVRDLAAKGFYAMHDAMPFVPLYVIGQGSQIKKLGANKYRRTSNFSAPHKEVRDKWGQKVVAVNEASRCYYLPEWLAKAKDERLRRWDEQRHAHVRWTDAEQRQAPVKYKFPKEHKPRLTDFMRDTAILLRAAIRLQEPIFVWVEDAAYYFNQLGYAPEELWKSNLVVGARPDDLTWEGQPLEEGKATFVSESRLGFGSFASSNLAQRFSNALVEWTLERFDELEHEALTQGDNQGWKQYREQRYRLEPRCREERPKVKGEAITDCTQTRLASIHMYTDDPVIIVVGVARAIRIIQAWREVTGRIGVTMAGAEKRQIGPQAMWIGVTVLAALGVVVITREKLLRAREAIQRTMRKEITYGEYRALMGLLEHLRFIARIPADSTNALYRPHSSQGESQEGPGAVIEPTPLMQEKLVEWLRVIMRCAGALCTMVFTESTVEAMNAAHDIIQATSDAAGEGLGTSGIGGYVHGRYWRLPIPTPTLSRMHITAWEALAAAVSALVAARLAGPSVTISVRSDALLVAHAVARGTSRSESIQVILHELKGIPSYHLDIAQRIVVQHVSGDGNVFSDLVSRGLWRDFEELCTALRIKANPIELDKPEQEFVKAVLCRHGATRAEANRMLESIEIPKGESWIERWHRREGRARPMAQLEKGLGSARRDNTDGDGPTAFRPPWRKAGKEGASTAGPKKSVGMQKQENKFTPPWKQREQRQHKESSPKQRDYGAEDSSEAQRIEAVREHTDARDVYARKVRERTAGHDGRRTQSERLVERLVRDRTAGSINAPAEEIRGWVEAVWTAKTDGHNPRTLDKDRLACGRSSNTLPNSKDSTQTCARHGQSNFLKERA